MNLGSDHDPGFNTAIEEVVTYIKGQVMLGVLSPGHRLIENDVMKATEASRGHVRNAFKQLAAEGYVQIEHNKGARIRKLTRLEVEQMYQLRELLEGLAARLAAQARLTNAQRALLKKMQTQMDKVERDVQLLQFRKLNIDYHRWIQHASGNTVLTDHLEQLRLPLLQVQFHRFFDVKAMIASNADHRLITQAILDGDAVTAEKITTRHVCDGLKAIRKMDDQYFS